MTQPTAASLLKDTGCKPQAHGQAEPGGGPCPRCQRPRCCATAKTRDNERCRKNPHPGATICTNHGLTEAGRAKAAERRTAEAAGRVLAKLWDPDAVPVTAPVPAMQKLAGQMAHAVEVLGAWLSHREVCEECGRGPVELGSPEGVAWLRQQRELRQLLEAMERLGIAQAQVELEEARLELIATALGRVFEALGLDQEQSTTGLRVFFAELRAGGGTVPPALEAGAAS